MQYVPLNAGCVPVIYVPSMLAGSVPPILCEWDGVGHYARWYLEGDTGRPQIWWEPLQEGHFMRGENGGLLIEPAVTTEAVGLEAGLEAVGPEAVIGPAVGPAVGLEDAVTPGPQAIGQQAAGLEAVGPAVGHGTDGGPAVGPEDEHQVARTG